MAKDAASQALLFDVGGVIVKAHPDPQFVANLIGDGAPSLVSLVDQAMWAHRDSYDAGCSDREFWDQVAGDCGKPEVTDHVLSQLVAHDVARMHHPDDITVALINELHAEGVRLGILSNAPKSIAEEIRKTAWAKPFDELIFSHEHHVNKPSRGIYREAVKQMGVPADQLIFIDDRKRNVRAAELLGMGGIIWESAAQVREELVSRGILPVTSTKSA
ncbi:HAD family phosphatase [Schaalia sp. ZJ1691]|uniref:HAD family hydrolase n=1 Tax=Schaalia sp. ZJ1691 TaxID=2709404 RepID=UPI0013EB9293|nr:HAD family phosphatase [Schaalia sp. ZJ1691]